MNDIEGVVAKLHEQAAQLEVEAAQAWARDPSDTGGEIARLNARATMLRDRAALMHERAAAWTAYNATQPLVAGKSDAESAAAMAAHYRTLAERSPEAAPALLESAARWQDRAATLQQHAGQSVSPVTPAPAPSMDNRPTLARRESPSPEPTPPSLLTRLNPFARATPKR